MNIFGYTFKMLQDYFLSFGENPAKAKIVYNAIYKQKIKSFFEIENLSQSVTEKLNSDFSIEHIRLVKKSENDSSCKYLFELEDGQVIESVLMKHDYGNGVCISTQVGCNMDCAFCESGKLKKVRNLTSYEMVQQFLYIKDVLDIPVSHIVLMGIGEPFDNYDNTMDFIDIVTNQAGINLAPRHITISTSGIAPKIIEYSKRDILNSLAISLHAPTDELRSKIMPINKKYPVKDLMEAADIYTKKCKKKITFAYIMIKDLNDTKECAKKLSELVKDLNCYVNLIPYNKTRSTDYEPSSKESISAFFDILKSHGINVTVRREFGGNINAACGQLSSDYKSSM